MIYEFENCALDTATQELRRDGEPVHVEPQVLAVLEYLAKHRDRVVTKIELLDEVWGDRFVSESALTSRIKLARRACGDSGREQRILKTIHSRGYRFAADVVERTSGSDSGAHQPEPASTSAGSRPHPPTRASLVGRDAELDALDQALATTAAGTHYSVFVTGDSGVGKTALVAEFIERNDVLESWLVLRGRCLQARGAVEPYFALLDALTQLGRTQPELMAATLERVAPSWLAQIPSLLDDATAERLERRLLGTPGQRMLREGVEALRALAATRPLVLVLEDLQWADDCTLDVVDLLSQRGGHEPLLLLATARLEPGPAQGVVASATAGSQGMELELTALDAAAIETLAQDRLGVERVDPALVALIGDRSGGLPLFAHEIITAWLRQDLVAIEDRTATPASSADVLAATVPDALRTLLERELATLHGTEADVLEAAAVAGPRFAAASVAAALDMEVGDAERELASVARRLHYIEAHGGEAWPDGTVSTGYAFTHHLVRDVVNERTTAGTRARYHGRLGEALEQSHADRIDEVVVTMAEHFVEAADAPRAVEYLRRAGELAAERSAHEHAAQFLRRALDWAQRLAPGLDRDRAELKVQTALGAALVATLGWFDAEVSRTYERAIALCPKVGSCPESAAARYGLATVTELRGEFERTEALLSPLLADESSGDLAMEAHELIACSLFHQGSFDKSATNAGIVLESWDPDAYSVPMSRIAEHPASSCNSWMSVASWHLGQADESLERAERAVELGEQNRYALSTALQMRAMLHQLRREPDECLYWAERTRAIGGEQDFPMRVIQADMFKGWAMGVLGDSAEGLGLIGDGIARFRDAGATLNAAYYLAMLAETQLGAGRWEEALTTLDEALTSMESTTRSYFYASEIHRLRAQALRAAQATDAARTELDEALEIARQLGSPVLELRAVADLMTLESESTPGDDTSLRAQLAELLDVFAGQRRTPDMVRAEELLGIG